MNALLEQASAEGTPLIDGEKVTFVWQGEDAPHLVGDFNYWALEDPALDLDRAAPDLWVRTVPFPRDAYIEYAYTLDGARMPDPLNRSIARDGMGHVNSYFRMPAATDTPLARPQRGVPRGTVTRHTVPGNGYVAGNTRTVHLYQPPVEKPCPLLVVFDGSGYLRRARLATIVDNLIAQGRIGPLALALVDPGGRGRTVEYACSDTTVAFIVHCVLPLARERLNLVDVANSPGAYGMMGASMGGLMSLYTALRAPDIFGHVLCESGAFGADRLYYRSVIYDLIRLGPVAPLKIWMDVGQHEWFLEPNRQMRTLLQERGYDVTYIEHSSGHNYPSWRNVLWRGLDCLYK